LVDPSGGLNPKMAFYAYHFLELRDGLIVGPAKHFDIGGMPSVSHSGGFGLALIVFELFSSIGL
jgi:hypothetical protein